ncbi:hypothetical protein [Mameliella alba]|uniref:hypothetical protein n=1 Tax=Mameliella alba TaxID=561184 RepID=UPI0008898A99|nr:hypothetical protein [Mameliella alba]MBY6118985.1 hypothetical protein [Mameliella alba]OWV43901.1 hypothetical protein CDZ95_09610 [Mameliella alba]OWV49192.1 hypothetical protein CDZ96_07040 [Mameliella alba]OWV67571.1 hypothetical protein CDZ97_03840 [Mameliella alba]PTR40813.1 hypothetical protein LX94_01267 [Mameliella alba]
MKRLISMILACLAASPAFADSCWDHNGSIMRLTDQGNNRWFWYETTPHSWQYPAGVTPGVLLFNGWKNGEWYSGTARRFSKYCPGTPLEYHVEGPVLQNPLRVQLTGQYQVQQNCQPTGEWRRDTLVFTYRYQC